MWSKVWKLIKEACKILEEGGIVIYPTESSYAIGADITNEEALKKVYEIKGRDLQKKLTCIVANLNMADKYSKMTELEKTFVMLAYPRPITLVTQKNPKYVSDLFNTEFPFRIPSNYIALELVRRFGKPITATSANISGQEPIYEEKELYEVFGNKADLIISIGDLPKRPVSTIVRIYKGKLEILREGAVPKEEVEEIYKKALEFIKK